MKSKLKTAALSLVLTMAIVAALEALPKPRASAGLPEIYATLLSAPIYPPGMANRYVEIMQLYIAAANEKKRENEAIETN